MFDKIIKAPNNGNYPNRKEKKQVQKGANYKHHLSKWRIRFQFIKRVLNKAFEWLLKKSVTSTYKKANNNNIFSRSLVRICFRKMKSEKHKTHLKWKINVKIKLDVMRGIYPLSFVTEYACVRRYSLERKKTTSGVCARACDSEQWREKKRTKELNRMNEWTLEQCKSTP